MKLLKTELVSEQPLEELPKGKAKLTTNGKDTENIWVAKDISNNKMYLLNHALAFYPFPSWGSEWPLGHSIDVAKAKGENPDDCILTVHADAYAGYQAHEGLLKEDGTIDEDVLEKQQ